VAAAAPAKKKLSFNEQREFEALPQKIQALEEEQQRLRHESESAEFYKEAADHIRAVLARIDQISQELEARLARWIELEDRSSVTSSRRNS
jgi:ATP-binding cassette subfamily F protein uup